jgi:hypothetical protein
MGFVLLFADIDHLVECVDYPFAGVSKGPVSEEGMVSREV